MSKRNKKPSLNEMFEAADALDAMIMAEMAEEAQNTPKDSPVYLKAMGYVKEYMNKHLRATVNDFFDTIWEEREEIQEINPLLFLMAMADINTNAIAIA